MVPLSAVLVAQDEEKTIGDALASVAFCDDIVLVDSGSTDRTREIAEAAGARVIVNAPWPGFVAQRSFATGVARQRLGAPARRRRAGERGPARGDRGAATAGLRRGGLSHPARGVVPRALDPRDGLVPRLAGAPLRPHPGRLAGRPRARVGGGARPLGRLRGELEHHPYADISDHLRKIDSYTTLWARQAHAAGRRSTWSTWRRARPGPSSAITCSREASCWAAPASPSRCSTRTTRSPSWRSSAGSCARAPRGMRRGVLHVDTAATWRGGQNQVLLTARGMAARGTSTAIACRAGGAI